MLLDAIVLPDDLEWEDEITWTPIAQLIERSVTGALFIQESEIVMGRPITLTGSDDMAWITRLIVDSLVVKRNTIGLKMDLTIGTGTKQRVFKVMFRQGENPVDVRPVRKGEAFWDNTWYAINAIRLMEVSP